MIEINISGHGGFDLSDKIKAYANEKIGGLAKYLPKAAKNARAKVVLSLDKSGREDNQFVCEVIINAPGAVIQSKEATLNMYAAIDIVEAKLKAQILKYKHRHWPGHDRTRRLLGRLRRGGDRV